MTTPPPPPAPFMGPGLAEVILAVQHHGTSPLQITLGRYAPRFVLRHVEGRYEVRLLVTDSAKAKSEQERRTVEGTFVPEMAWAALVPGPVVLQDADKTAFLHKLRAWPEWSDP